MTAPIPAQRDRSVDLVRVVAVAVVVVGHWLNAQLSVQGGRLTLDYVVLLVPATRYVTLALQVMPLVFLVGGYANAASWRAARDRQTSYGTWLRTRTGRLLGPAATLVGCWAAGGLMLVVLGVEAGQVAALARHALGVLWFLAVYVPAVAAAPVSMRLHERYGWRVVVALAVLAVTAELAGTALGVPLVRWTNLAWVWLAFHQLGHCWQQRGTVPARIASALLLGGATTLGVLLATGVSPANMIDRANTTPPSVALLALGLAHAGAVFGLQPALRRLADRTRVRRLLGPANALVMLAFLWHVTAMLLVGLALVLPGSWPAPAVTSPAWWALRLPWLGLLTALTVVLVSAAARAVRRGTTTRDVSRTSTLFVPCWRPRTRWWPRTARR